MSDNLKIWDALKTPPKEALSKIKGGRLNGMTDIKPQWRYKAMTEEFGAVGFGWGYSIKRLWTEACDDGTVCAFAEVSVWVKVDGEKSEPFDGIGGSMLVAKETAGLRTSDECYKMATTDALSVAMKMIGVGADVYSGNVSHDSKYSAPVKNEVKQHTPKTEVADDKNKATYAKHYKAIATAKTVTDVFKFQVLAESDATWNEWKENWQDNIAGIAKEMELKLKDSEPFT